jgi:hypothetical protein
MASSVSAGEAIRQEISCFGITAWNGNYFHYRSFTQGKAGLLETYIIKADFSLGNKEAKNRRELELYLDAPSFEVLPHDLGSQNTMQWSLRS